MTAGKERERIVAQLTAAYHNGQATREKAKKMQLPPDPLAWLSDYENYADSLPDDMPHKPVMQQQAQHARKNLTENNIDEAKFFMLQIQENWNNAEHDLWVLRLQRGSRSGGSKAATSKQAERNARAQEARDKYNRLGHIPKRDRTAIIAREMDLHPRTVRNYLNNTK